MVGRGAFLDHDEVLVRHVEPQPARGARREGRRAEQHGPPSAPAHRLAQGGVEIGGPRRDGKRQLRDQLAAQAAHFPTDAHSSPRVTTWAAGRSPGACPAIPRPCRGAGRWAAARPARRCPAPRGPAAAAPADRRPPGPTPLRELLEELLLGVLEGARQRLRVLGGEEAGVHPEEPLEGVAVLHGGPPVAVDERAACCRDMPAPSAISCCVYLRPFGFSRVRRSRSSRCRKRACTSGSPAGCPLSSALTTGSGTPDATDSGPRRRPRRAPRRAGRRVR